MGSTYNLGASDCDIDQTWFKRGIPTPRCRDSGAEPEPEPPQLRGAASLSDQPHPARHGPVAISTPWGIFMVT